MRITRSVAIDEGEINERFIRASGPGGQNVNKVETAVQLQFDAANSPNLAPEVRERLVRLAGQRASSSGVITIEARRYRTRERNRVDARERLSALIRRALETPKARRKTRPPKSAERIRLEEKRRQGRAKRLRGRVGSEE